MPDDWQGHPQRKDYPLGGIPVEYKGARDTAARRAEVVQLMSAAPTATYTVHGPGLGRDRRGRRARTARSGSSSTWARSTPRRTGCCG